MNNKKSEADKAVTVALGNKVNELLKAKGMTQKELAERVNVVDKTIMRCVHGVNKPREKTIKAMANVFGVTEGYLLGTEK